MIALLVTACQGKQDTGLCPDLSQVGQGNKAYEAARSCVRLMAARYAVSGETPSDIATSAIEFCRNRKIEPIVADQNNIVLRQKLLVEIEKSMRSAAIHTVVEMRSGDCQEVLSTSQNS